MPTPLTILIATARRKELLDSTLASLAETRKPISYRETVIVENGPKTGTEEVAARYGGSINARYIHVPAAGLSNARNAGLATIEDGLVYFTDDDIRFAPDTLEAYAEAAGNRTQGQFYGGPTRPDYVREPPEWIREYLFPCAQGFSLGNSVRQIERSAFLGHNWAAFASDLKRLGGFNTNYGLGSASGSLGEESEMQGRLLRNGCEGIYLPGALVWHYVPPERCSPMWTLKRYFFSGVQNGMHYGGKPRWSLPRWIREGLSVLSNAARGRASETFGTLCKLCFTSGYMRGNLIVQNKAPTGSGPSFEGTEP